MAAAALRRSMARKLARAPPPPPRPLLAAGLRSGPAGSLPPLTRNQSLATKIARAPPHPHHRHILNRGLHSGSTPTPTPTPTADKDKIIEDLRRRLSRGRAMAGMGTIVLLGVGIYWQFWVLPELKKQRDKSLAFERLQHDLKDIIGWWYN